MKEVIKEAVILAAGKGSRIKRANISKPMIPVYIKPLICYAIDALIDYGVETIWIVKHVSESFDVIDQHYANANVSIKYIEELERKGSLHSFLGARDYINDTFICMDCDIIVEKKAFTQMINDGLTKMQQKKLFGVMACVLNPRKVDNDMLLLNNEQVIRFIKVGSPECKRGGYVYIWRKKVFDDICFFEEKQQYSLSVYYDYIVRKHRVGIMEIEDMWDVDTDDDIEFACNILNEGVCDI